MYDVHNYYFKVQFSAYQGLLVVSFSVLYCTTFYILKKEHLGMQLQRSMEGGIKPGAFEIQDS